MSRHVRLGECSGITPQVLWDDGRVWHKSAERVVYSGYRTILSRTFATPDGIHDFEIKLEPDAAVVLALTATREELPGGNVDGGERPDVAASRELLEETGFAVSLRYAGALVDGAYSTRRCHVFVGDDARRLYDSPEGLEIVLMSLAEFREHLRGGQLTDVGAGYRGLDALGLL